MTFPANAITVKLSRPLETSKGEINEIHLREPTVRDKIMYEKNKGSALEKEIAMIASLSGLEPGDVHDLPVCDYSRLGKALNDFLLPPEERLSKD